MSTSLARAFYSACSTWGLSLAGVAFLLAGCATPEVKDIVQLGAPHIELLLAPRESFALRVGKAPALPMTDYTSVRVEGAWVVGAHRLVLLQGATKQCRQLQTLVTVTEDTTAAQPASARPLGGCEERFTITWTGEQLTARQIGARDPALWSFRNGTLNGPVPLSTLIGRRGRGATALGAGSSNSGSGPMIDAPDMVPPPPIVPPVSRPVGEDVIPPPVGGGPLPRRIDAPRLF